MRPALRLVPSGGAVPSKATPPAPGRAPSQSPETDARLLLILAQRDIERAAALMESIDEDSRPNLAPYISSVADAARSLSNESATLVD